MQAASERGGAGRSGHTLTGEDLWLAVVLEAKKRGFVACSGFCGKNFKTKC